MSIREDGRKDPLGLGHVLLKGNLGRRESERMKGGLLKTLFT
jgi:hypothetical protein